MADGCCEEESALTNHREKQKTFQAFLSPSPGVEMDENDKGSCKGEEKFNAKSVEETNPNATAAFVSGMMKRVPLSVIGSIVTASQNQ